MIAIHWPLIVILFIISSVTLWYEPGDRAGFLVTAAATLVGVMVAFYLNSLLQYAQGKQEKKVERQRLLVFLKQELLSNLKRVTLITQAINTQKTAKRQVALNDVITGLAGSIRFDVYHAMQNAGYFRSLEDNEVFGKIITSYVRLEEAQSSHRVTELKVAGSAQSRLGQLAFEELGRHADAAASEIQETLARLNVLLEDEKVDVPFEAEEEPLVTDQKEQSS